MLNLRKLAGVALSAVVVATSFATANAQTGTIVDVATKDGRFTTLLAAVEAAGLVETLNGAGPFTVFAPTDDAFAKLPKVVIDYLLAPANKELLTKTLTYHVVSGKVLAADVVNLTEADTVAGEKLTVEATDAGVRINGVNIAVTDVQASNGVIHVINGVLVPNVELPEADVLGSSGPIIASGSSTVFPIAERAQVEIKAEGFTGDIKLDSIGTGGGFERFCKNAETDLANASRAIKKEELDACVASGREPIVFAVGIDAIAVVVSKQNTFATNLTKAQLADIFSGVSKNWSDVDASFPAEPIRLFSPGTDSGTFDYFVEIILNKDKNKILNAGGVQFSEDDNVLVQGVEGSQYAIGYFGFAYFSPNADKLNVVSVDGITPSFETAESGQYILSRPLYIYTTAEILKEKPQVATYLNYILTNVNGYLGTETGKIGYFPVTNNNLNLAKLTLIAATAE